MKINKKFINKIDKGDRDAEEKLFDYTKSKIKKFLEMKYPKSTEDDTSDIIIKIFENIKKYNAKKSKYSTWITNVAKNHMIDKSRVYANNVFFVSATTGSVGMDCLDVICSNNGNGDTTFNLSSDIDFTTTFDTNDEIKSLSSSISPSDFSMLKMKYYNGYNYDEIGKEVDMDKTKVLNRVNYIKRKLKKGE